MRYQNPNCALCPIKTSERICKIEEGKYPPFCPTVYHKEVKSASTEEYSDSVINEFARQSSIQESEAYGNKDKGYEYVKPIKPRIQEIIEFAGKMNYKRLGLLFCIGLHEEAQKVGKLLNSKGFDLISVICKVGRVPKEDIGINDDQKISIGKHESMCNPILQAMIVNKEQTDFNILLGLCVGHDSLVFKYAKAPCTVLAVKDRLLGHNPLAAIYNLHHYYRYLNDK
ncbi:MAG: DUF1847 domain-containing protein [Desulfovermiculus sp.]|nr:DUF1847 domain-containing protein [Desulfovermiculus sp.]